MGAFDDLPEAATQPSAKATGAGVFDDLPQAVEKSQGAFDDLPKSDDSNPQHAELRAAPPLGFWERAGRALSPLLGPTETQKLEEGVTITGPDGKPQRVYKPAGSLVEKEGFFPALSHPAVPLPRVQGKADDSTLTALGKAALNTGENFAEFFESPLGVATMGVGELANIPRTAMAATPEARAAVAATRGLQRATTAGFALDMATKTPEAASQAGTISVTGTPQQKFEADLGLGAHVIVTGSLIGHATGAPEYVANKLGATPGSGTPAISVTMPTAPAGRANDGTVSEFGGAAPAQAAPPAPAPEPEAKPTAPAAPQPTTSTAVATPNGATAAPVQRVSADQIVARPDLMQFKRMDDMDSGVNAQDKLGGNWDDLKGGNLLLWEPKDPAAYGLAPGQKYIVANGHHRFEFGERQNVPQYNAQIIREADGYSAQDARALAAEVNIADGKGTIYDQVKFLRNESATHGTDAALARAGRIGIKGRQASTIAFAAGPDLYTSFVNEQIKPDQAETIAKAAPPGTPQSEGLQRLGIRKAIDGASPAELSNLIQAVRLEARNVPAQQFDLFAADDSALNAAQELASVASRIQGELSREIKATDNAAKAATTAKAKGIKFERDPQEILADNAKLRAERDRWDNWALHPELVQQVRDYAAMKRGDSGEQAPAATTPEPAAEAPKKPKTVYPSAQTEAAGVTDSGNTTYEAEFAKWDKSELARKEPPQDTLFDAPSDLSKLHEGDRVPGREPGSGIPGRLDSDSGEPGRQGAFAGGAAPAKGELQPAGAAPTDTSRLAELQRRIELTRDELSQSYTSHPQLRARLQSELDDLLVQEASLRNSANAFLDALRGNPEWTALARDREQGRTYDRNRMAQIEQQTRAQLATPPRTIEQRLDALKFNTQGKLFEGVTSLPIHLWNASIDVIKLAVKGGKTLANAIDDGVAWLKQNYPAVGFNEQEYRNAVMDQYGMREFGEKLRADPNVPDGTKAQVSEWIYKKLTDADALTEARTLIDKQGIDSAIQAFKHAEMHEGIRSALGKEIIQRLTDDSLAARKRGDTAQAEQLEAKQASFIDFELKRDTSFAQALQKMSLYGDMSPRGVLKHAQKVLNEEGDRQMQQLQPVTELIRDGFQKANEKAVQQTIQDPDVNKAAREAVNEHVSESMQTHRAVVMEITGVFSQVPEIVRQARELVRANADKILKRPGELLTGLPNPPLGTRTKAEFAKMMEELGKRIASIAAGHYQGSEPGKTLATKIRERTGLTEDAAKRIALAMDKKFAEMVEEARKKLPERIAAQRAKLAEPFDPNETTQPAVDREIKKQLQAMNVRLGELVKQHSSTVDATGKSIADRVVTAAGLTGEAANKLRDAFNKRFEALATQAKRTAVQAILNNGNKIPARVRNAVGDLIKMTNTGAFDDAKFYDAVRKRLDLPTVTPDLARELVRRANEMQQLPAGFQRDRAAVKLLDYIARQKPLKLWELPMAIWYANVLSGITTHTHVMIDNIGQLAGNTLVAMARHPGAIPDMAKALARGTSKGTLHAAEILKTGVVTGIRENVHTSHQLERNPFKGPLSFYNNWKYVGRTIAATHVFLFKPAYEMKQALIARDVAKGEGLTGDALKQRVADIMGNVEARTIAARAQATAEGLTGLDLRRRTAEILEQQREQAVPGITENARQYALRSTYLQDPYGIAGFTAQKLNEYFQELEKRNPVFGPLARITSAPFMRIAGNILDEKLNWTPVGAVRAFKASRKGEVYGQPIADKDAIGDLYTKAILGTIGTAALAMTGAATGNGPANPNARQQLMETGWRPHSIKIGDHYFSYLRTPIALPLSVIGNYQDAQRYQHLDDTSAIARMAYAWGATTDTILGQSYLDTVGNLFEAAKNPDPKQGGKQWEQVAARMGSKFVVPNLAMQIDRIFDPTLYNDNDIKAMLRAQVPFVRRMNSPVLNVLGEPVQRGIFDRDVTGVKPDELWQTIADKQAWVPIPSRDVIVGDKKRGPDHYRALTPGEFYEYAKDSGQAIRDRLEPKLEKLQNMEPDQAKALVQQISEEQRRKTLRHFAP